MARFVSSIHFDPSFWQHEHHTRVVEFYYVIFLFVWFRVDFLLRDKQEAKFGGVMSVQNTHVITASLLHFSYILYINKCIITLYLIFGSFVHYR